MVDDGVVGDRDDPGVGESPDGFAEDVAPVESGVHVADFGRIVAVAVMVAGVDHRTLDAGELQHPDILRRVEAAHESGIQVGDVVVDQHSGIAFFQPGHGNTSFVVRCFLTILYSNAAKMTGDKIDIPSTDHGFSVILPAIP